MNRIGINLNLPCARAGHDRRARRNNGSRGRSPHRRWIGRPSGPAVPALFGLFLLALTLGQPTNTTKREPIVSAGDIRLAPKTK
jgi:hypothetical protein